MMAEIGSLVPGGLGSGSANPANPLLPSYGSPASGVAATPRNGSPRHIMVYASSSANSAATGPVTGAAVATTAATAPAAAAAAAPAAALGTNSHEPHQLEGGRHAHAHPNRPAGVARAAAGGGGRGGSLSSPPPAAGAWAGGQEEEQQQQQQQEHYPYHQQC
ncbi:hypothetical protein CLOM_g1057 [Closterium sp. NIES-68]|nr:hypothetical protein CLOM_g1057 [Closterium sp. NIES-68]